MQVEKSLRKNQPSIVFSSKKKLKNENKKQKNKQTNKQKNTHTSGKTTEIKNIRL